MHGLNDLGRAPERLHLLQIARFEDVAMGAFERLAQGGITMGKQGRDEHVAPFADLLADRSTRNLLAVLLKGLLPRQDMQLVTVDKRPVYIEEERANAHQCEALSVCVHAGVRALDTQGIQRLLKVIRFGPRGCLSAGLVLVRLPQVMAHPVKVQRPHTTSHDRLYAVLH
jgi:hypothetical protein